VRLTLSLNDRCLRIPAGCSRDVKGTLRIAAMDSQLGGERLSAEQREQAV
jgi:hypothetical protein